MESLFVGIRLGTFSGYLFVYVLFGFCKKKTTETSAYIRTTFVYFGGPKIIKKLLIICLKYAIVGPLSGGLFFDTEISLNISSKLVFRKIVLLSTYRRSGTLLGCSLYC